MADRMHEPRRIVTELFSRAGIKIGGSEPWDIRVDDEHFYTRVLTDPSLGLGEAYMDGQWSCGDLAGFFCRILKAGLDRQANFRRRLVAAHLLARLRNPQSRRRARQVAEHHYDLGNDLFAAFLDPYNQYSCAYFHGTDDLAEAQQRKLDLICRKLGVGPGDELLDIGCGWGGLARYAAEHCGCRVTGVTISKEQVGFAKEFCRGLPVRILECEYRDIQGRFDKIVSVGMFEHVGRKNYRTFIEVVDRCLKEGGSFLLHTIGGNRSTDGCDPWIQKYIFPNGMLPSVTQVGKAVEELFVMEDWHNLGPHYDRTLVAWNENFQASWERLRERYGERFRRMWEYFLLSCAGSFRAREIQLWQIVFTKRGTSQPDCRK